MSLFVLVELGYKVEILIKIVSNEYSGLQLHVL
jgi:hypothetical protein